MKKCCKFVFVLFVSLTLISFFSVFEFSSAGQPKSGGGGGHIGGSGSGHPNSGIGNRNQGHYKNNPNTQETYGHNIKNEDKSRSDDKNVHGSGKNREHSIREGSGNKVGRQRHENNMQKHGKDSFKSRGSHKGRDRIEGGISYCGGWGFVGYFPLDFFWVEIPNVEFGDIYPYKGSFVRPIGDGCYEYSPDGDPDGQWTLRCPEQAD